MGDGHRRPPAPGQVLQFAQPGFHRRHLVDVVEEDVALGERHAELAGQGRSYRPSGGPRIQEQQPPRLQFTHHQGHPRPVGGELAAHVVVDADVRIEAAESPLQIGEQAVVPAIAEQDVGAGIQFPVGGFHWYMQKQFVATGARRRGLVVELFRIRQERKGERPGEGDDTARTSAVDTHVVDDHRDHRPPPDFRWCHGETLPPRQNTRRQGLR